MVKAGSSRVIVKRETYDDLIKKRRVSAAGGFVFLLAFIFILYVTESTEKDARRRLLKEQLMLRQRLKTIKRSLWKKFHRLLLMVFRKRYSLC